MVDRLIDKLYQCVCVCAVCERESQIVRESVSMSECVCNAVVSYYSSGLDFFYSSIS